MIKNKQPEELLVYALRDPRDGMIRYIGQTIHGLSRPRQHLKDTKRGTVKNQHLHNWIQQLIKLDLEPDIMIIESGHNSREDLGDAEEYWIQYLMSNGVPLVNLRSGGRRSSVSEETKKKLSEYRGTRSHMYGKKHSQDMIKILSLTKIGNKNPNFGKKPSEITLKKLSAASTGKKLSVEARKKISLSKIGDKNHNFGKLLSEEYRKKISLSLTGKKRNSPSIETRMKISMALSGRSKKKQLPNADDRDSSKKNK